MVMNDEQAAQLVAMTKAGVSSSDLIMAAAKGKVVYQFDDGELARAREFVNRKQELIRLVMEDEHVSNCQSYMSKAHEVINSVKPNATNIDVYLKSLQLLDNVKRSILGQEKNPGAKASALAINIQNSNDLNPEKKANLQVYEA